MPILFTCPHCGRQTSVADELAGHSGPCAQCGKTITIPGSPAPPPRPPAQSWNPVVIVLAVVGGLFAVLFCGGILIALLLPAVQATREGARRTVCRNNIKQICIALQGYELQYGVLPAPGGAEKDGQPGMSWRVAILPYLEPAGIYQTYDPQQPWDSPKNRALAGAAMPSAYRCPSDPKAGPGSDETSYVMLVGKNTVGGLPDGDRKASYVSGHAGTSKTILVIEVPGSGIPWMEPRDMTVDEVLQRINSPNRGGHIGGVNVGFCDGSVRFIPYDVLARDLRAMADPDNTAVGGPGEAE